MTLENEKLAQMIENHKIELQNAKNELADIKLQLKSVKEDLIKEQNQAVTNAQNSTTIEGDK